MYAVLYGGIAYDDGGTGGDGGVCTPDAEAAAAVEVLLGPLEAVAVLPGVYGEYVALRIPHIVGLLGGGAIVGFFPGVVAGCIVAVVDGVAGID